MTTEDESREGYQKIKGRWWRTTDPFIPERLRQELVNELMSARRAVANAKKVDGDDEMTAARFRVHNAKCALGERGYKWWLTQNTEAAIDATTDTGKGICEEADDNALQMRILTTICALLHYRDTGSICPSEVARIATGSQWRGYMRAVRESAQQLAHHGIADITQKGISVQPPFKGPVRVRRGPRFLFLSREQLQKIQKEINRLALHPNRNFQQSASAANDDKES